MLTSGGKPSNPRRTLSAWFNMASRTFRRAAAAAEEMLRRLKEFKVGDKVRVEWVFEEHYRVEAIRKID